MRTSIQLLSFIALFMSFGPLNAQTGFQVVTGPTSFTGASNLEDGIQISSTGAYSTQFAMFTDLLPYCSADAELNWGSLGLTAADRRHELSEWYGVGAGLRLHQPYDADRVVQPWIGLGVSFVQQTNWADLTDANGHAYFYWSDGKVYDMAEDEPNAYFRAEELAPDYSYESETAKQRGLALPIRVGMNLNLTPRLYASAAFSMLAGAESSLDPRPGYRDLLTTAQAGIGLRIGKEYAEPRIQLPTEWEALGNDFDQDGIKDSRDRCPGTPLGAVTDKRGCPVDSDKDGVADFCDDEPFSPHTRVNFQGVALSEAQWEAVNADVRTKVLPVNEVFQRIETPDQLPASTPVNSNGWTPAELRLLKSFGSEKTTIPVKAKATPVVKAVKSTSALIKDHELEGFRAIMPAARPTYRVQLAPDVRTLDMNHITPYLLDGVVIQKFDQMSIMTFVTQPVFSMKDAEAALEFMKNEGFETAFIVGEFNGRLIDATAVAALEAQLLQTTASAQ